MKRRQLVRHLEKKGCYRHREGANHFIFTIPPMVDVLPFPRYLDVKETTARTICDKLGIDRPYFN